MNKLKEVREKHKMSCNQLSLISKVSNNTVKQIESGQRRPYWQTIVKLAEALNCDPCEIDDYDRPELKTCVICGKKYVDSPSNKNKTCRNKECSNIYRSKLSKKNKDTLNIAHAAISTSPLTGAFKTNHSAKEWTIVSPSGVKYSFRNLSLWAREHEDILPSTVKQFVTEISHIKQGYLGKRKKPASQYKGWVLESWED